MIKLRSEQLVIPTWIVVLFVLIIVALGILDIWAHNTSHSINSNGKVTLKRPGEQPVQIK